jgi:hypothetical protein
MSPVRAAAGFDGGCETPLPEDVEVVPDEPEELDDPDDEPDEELDDPAEPRGIACPWANAGTASPATTANAAR